MLADDDDKSTNLQNVICIYCNISTDMCIEEDANLKLQPLACFRKLSSSNILNASYSRQIMSSNICLES